MSAKFTTFSTFNIKIYRKFTSKSNQIEPLFTEIVYSKLFYSQLDNFLDCSITIKCKYKQFQATCWKECKLSRTTTTNLKSRIFEYSNSKCLSQRKKKQFSKIKY
uniref:Uncharacterized protein n=1 Tax=Megaselia scalaris TaxID=36166 RepID=T1H2P6_MEGSC